jgi:hypothetical protein
MWLFSYHCKVTAWVVFVYFWFLSSCPQPCISLLIIRGKGMSANMVGVQSSLLAGSHNGAAGIISKQLLETY